MSFQYLNIMGNNPKNVSFIYYILFRYFINKEIKKILKPNVKLLFKDTMNYIYSKKSIPIVFDS
jgi:hypothetical protein